MRPRTSIALRAGFLVAATAPLLLNAQGGDESTRQKIFRRAPVFEESFNGTGDTYIWRKSRAIVELRAGGNITVQTAEGEAHIRFGGANVESKPRGQGPSTDTTGYYLGPEKDWRTASNFDRVRYSNLYPGVDVVFITNQRALEYTFEIAPYADPSRIRIAYEGTAVRLGGNGDLKLSFNDGDGIKQNRPIAFQTVAGRKRSVKCIYLLSGDNEATLRLGPYDRTRALVVDPVLSFSTYLGGSSYDAINGAATDAAGNLYVTGETSSGSLTNASLAPRSSREAFIAKFNSSGTQVSVVYLGGSSYDSGRAIALDAAGNIYITGVTESSNFPVTSGVLKGQAPGTQEAFVAKFNSKLALQYSTYLGGGNGDAGLGIAVDSSGDAYVAGQTASTNFPVTQGAFESSMQGGISDCFISKLNPSGSALLYSTYLGGSALDLCSGIALDASGNAYLTGTTYSSNFPLAGAMQSNIGGTATAFVTKVNASGSALVYSTYLGGSVRDNGNGIAVDSSGAAYVTGYTGSPDFPTTAGVFQSSMNGQSNAFVSKISAAGSGLVYSTLIGGSGADAATSIAIDSLGRAVIGGYTSSSNYPLSGAIQATFAGAFDAFATVLDPAGATLVFSSYFGGSGDDQGFAVAAAFGNTLYLAGMTSSSNFPIENAIQSGLQVAPDAFALSVPYSGGQPAVVSVAPNSGSGMSQTFTLEYSDTAGAGSLEQVGVWFNATLASVATNSCSVFYNIPSNDISLLNNQVNGLASASPGAATTLQNNQCSINASTATVSSSGDTLTLTLTVTFSASYAGAKNIYMYAMDAQSNTQWQSEGTWTVATASAKPAVVSLAPDSGSGMSQTFTLEYSDTAGAASLLQVGVWFNATLASVATNSCSAFYNVPSNEISLLNNQVNGLASASPGAATALQNSQCSINATTATVSSSGDTLTLTISVTFSASYAGAKNIYMYAMDAESNTQWQPQGTWTVPSTEISLVP